MSINNRFRTVADAEKDKFDTVSRAVTVIQEQHRLSHEGFMFHASGKVLAIANAADADFMMITPAGCYPHVQRVRLDGEAGNIDLTMHEGITTSADGGALPVQNVNRNSTNAACAEIYGGPTVTDTGELFHTHWVPPTGAGIGSSIGVMDINAFGEEWALMPSTKYLFRITNNSGGTLDLRWEFVWYEVDWAKAGH